MAGRRSYGRPPRPPARLRAGGNVRAQAQYPRAMRRRPVARRSWFARHQDLLFLGAILLPLVHTALRPPKS